MLLSLCIMQDAFVAARDALNFRNRLITETELLNAINNCLRLLQALQNAISDEKYKPEKQSWKSLKLFILEFSEPLPDWVYERDYLLDWIKLYSNNGSFTYITGSKYYGKCDDDEKTKKEDKKIRFGNGKN